ncbi:MAG TPA: efflux RND transporter periplasmic adaptor subunit [bacterium]|nr:efflux RND transporter periplasmic adaptor subunit [bacterium]
MKKGFVIPFLAVVLFFSSCSEGIAKDNQIEKEKLAKKVEVIRPLKKKMPVRIEAGTTLKADEESKISAEVSAPLIKWFVEENSFVKKGDPIAKLDPVNYEIQKNQAVANLKALESKYDNVLKNYERLKRLVEKESYPKQQLDQIESQVESFKSQIVVVAEGVELANRMVEKTTVKAPFSGIVTGKKIAVGEFVPAGGKELITLVKTDVLEAQINISEMFYGKVGKDSTVIFYVSAIDKKIKGVVKSVAKNIDNMKQFNVIVGIENKNNNIPAGIYAVAEIISKDEERIILPVSSIKETGKNKGEVYTVDKDGSVQKVSITTSIVFEEGVEVTGEVPEFVIKNISSAVVGEKVEYSL